MSLRRIAPHSKAGIPSPHKIHLGNKADYNPFHYCENYGAIHNFDNCYYPEEAAEMALTITPPLDTGQNLQML